METADFVKAVEERLGGEFGGANATITDRETYDEKIEEDNNGKIIAVEYKTKTLKHPRLYVYVDDTSKPQDDCGVYPAVGIMVRNPKITDRNAKNLSTRCGNVFRMYFTKEQKGG